MTPLKIALTATALACLLIAGGAKEPIAKPLRLSMCGRLPRLLTLLLATVILMFGSAVGARATIITVEPDDFAVGSDLTNAFTGVTLTVEDRPAIKVISRDGFYVFNGRNLATTGSLVFGQDVLQPPNNTGQDWNEGEYGRLRADFDRPTDFVSIDLAFRDDDILALWAFDVNNDLLDMVQGSGDGRNFDVLFASITRPQADIAYILAGGVSREGAVLDNLQFSVIPEPSTLGLFAIGLTGLGVLMRRRRKTDAA